MKIYWNTKNLTEVFLNDIKTLEESGEAYPQKIKNEKK